MLSQASGHLLLQKLFLSDGLTKGLVFNGDNYAMGIRRQQSGSMVMIWGGMIENELTSLFRVPEELNCPLTCIARS